MFGSFVSIAYAQENTPGMAEAYEFVERVNQVILYPLITLLMGLALLIFIYGCFEYIQHSDDAKAREAGQMHIMWGIVGMFIMLVAYGILGIAAGTFGLEDELDCANDPSSNNCIHTDFAPLPPDDPRR
ncbi:MAG: pilin [Candidatus Pacebacteria bacterium]|jgi:fructose-specific phosphotransferase system IIC component|nr:pilin [Candidatus Paceibacterota bacterium]